MEDQRQKLYTTEINLAAEKQTVLNLKAELQKAKEAAQVAREVTEAAVNTSYKCGVLDTDTRLAEEVAIVYRDYVMESWGVAMDQAGVPVDSELMRVESIFYPKDIREVPSKVPPVEQPLTAQAPPLDGEVPKGAGVDEESQLLTKAKPFEDVLIIRDVVSQAKDAELKSQVDLKNPPPMKTNV